MQLTERGKKLLANGIAEGMADKENPFEREGGLVYLKYDGLEIRQADDVYGGVNVHFMWWGESMWIMRVEGTGMVNGDTLRLAGVEGRVMIHIG